MDSITTKLKIALVIVVLLAMVIAGWQLARKQDTSRDAACHRAAAENLGPTQGISADAAICNGTMQPGNRQ